jgi:hypothetical protein
MSWCECRLCMLYLVLGKASDWFEKGAVIGYEKKDIQVSTSLSSASTLLKITFFLSSWTLSKFLSERRRLLSGLTSMVPSMSALSFQSKERSSDQWKEGRRTVARRFILRRHHMVIATLLMFIPAKFPKGLMVSTDARPE